MVVAVEVRCSVADARLVHSRLEKTFVSQSAVGVLWAGSTRASPVYEQTAEPAKRTALLLEALKREPSGRVSFRSETWTTYASVRRLRISVMAGS